MVCSVFLVIFGFDVTSEHFLVGSTLLEVKTFTQSTFIVTDITNTINNINIGAFSLLHFPHILIGATLFHKTITISNTSNVNLKFTFFVI